MVLIRNYVRNKGYIWQTTLREFFLTLHVKFKVKLSSIPPVQSSPKYQHKNRFHNLSINQRFSNNIFLLCKKQNYKNQHNNL